MKFRWMIAAAGLALCLCACAPKAADTELKDTAPASIEIPENKDYSALLSSQFPVPAPDEAKQLAKQSVKLAEALYPEAKDGCTGNYEVSYKGTMTSDSGTFYYFDIYDTYEEAEGSVEYAGLCTIAAQPGPDAKNNDARYFLQQSDSYTEIRYDGKTASLIEDTDGKKDGSAG